MKTTRRQFAGLFLGGIFAAFFTGPRGQILSALAANKKKAAEATLPPGQVEANLADPVVVAIGYTLDATKADKKKFPQYKPGMKCSACALFTAQNDGYGKCQLIMNGLVRSGGWCGSFNKKV